MKKGAGGQIAPAEPRLEVEPSSELHLEDLASRIKAREVEFSVIRSGRILLDRIQEVNIRRTRQTAVRGGVRTEIRRSRSAELNVRKVENIKELR